MKKQGKRRCLTPDKPNEPASSCPSLLSTLKFYSDTTNQQQHCRSDGKRLRQRTQRKLKSFCGTLLSSFWLRHCCDGEPRGYRNRRSPLALLPFRGIRGQLCQWHQARGAQDYDGTFSFVDYMRASEWVRSHNPAHNTLNWLYPPLRFCRVNYI